jgi:two-component system, NarL family, sensor kinase
MLQVIPEEAWLRVRTRQADADDGLGQRFSSATAAVTPGCVSYGEFAWSLLPPWQAGDSPHSGPALRRAESTARPVTAALLHSQEMERKRVANELHDSIGQMVGNLRFGIAIALDMVRTGNSPDAETMLAGLGDQAKQAVDEVRRIAMGLRPAILDDLGIGRTLSWFFREFRAVHPDLTVSTDIAVGVEDIPVPLSTVIYRVIQEACNNVIRHAGASELQVTLHRLTQSIHLRVEDNGRGMPQLSQPCRQGLGLHSMRERVEFAGGHFCLESRPGGGTCIVADWPFSVDSLASASIDASCHGTHGT